MSYVIASPEYVAAAATDLANIGSMIGDANSAALGTASSVPPAGADEVSAVIASLFESHAQAYQALSAAAQVFHNQFVELMSAGGEQYAIAEAANATPLQTAGQSILSGGLPIQAPVQALESAATKVQPLLGSVASAGSAAAGVPVSMAGLAGGSAAPAVPAANVAAVTPAVTPAAFTPLTTTPVAAAAPVSAPVAALQAITPAYSPASVGQVVQAAAASPLAALSAETPAFTPPAAPTLPAVTPITGAPAASGAAYTPATGPYSPASGASCEPAKQQSGATGEHVETQYYSG